jgi:cyclopropane fatty-acyl-phospholipid synthase-like methyltransferase
VTTWVPGLDGVEDRLQRGIRVADIGCRHGAATTLMAQAYPGSTFVGSDSFAPSIASARDRASRAGLEGRVSFEVASAQTFEGGPYELSDMLRCSARLR